jgi:hypothetical protein
MGVVGMILVLGCLVSFGWFLFPGPVMPPAGSTVMYEEDVIEVVPDEMPANESAGNAR